MTRRRLPPGFVSLKWSKEATEAVLEFLGDTRVGCWASTRGARRPAEDVGQGDEGEEGGPGPP